MHVDKSLTKIQARVRPPPPIQAMPEFWEHLVRPPLPKSISFSLISYFNVLFSPAMQQSPAHRKFTGLETSWGGFLFFYHHQISLSPAEALNDLLFNADVLPRCSIGLLRFRSRIYGFQLCLSNNSCNFTIRFSLEDFFNPPLFFSFWDSCDMGFVGGW